MLCAQHQEGEVSLYGKIPWETLFVFWSCEGFPICVCPVLMPFLMYWIQKTSQDTIYRAILKTGQFKIRLERKAQPDVKGKEREMDGGSPKLPATQSNTFWTDTTESHWAKSVLSSTEIFWVKHLLLQQHPEKMLSRSTPKILIYFFPISDSDLCYSYSH